MGLETGTNVHDLVNTNPTTADGRHQGDDHLRLIKKVLLVALNAVPGMRDALPIDHTISSGGITPAADTTAFINLLGAAGADDDLDQIVHTNLIDGAIVILRGGGAEAITLKHNNGADDLINQDALDIILTQTDQFVCYTIDKTNSKSYELWRSANLPMGARVLAGTDALTLTGVFDEQLFQTVTASRIHVLPTTSVPVGTKKLFINTDTDDNMVIKPSDTNTLYTIPPGGSLEVVALIDTPVTGANWRKIGGSTNRVVYTSDDTFEVPAFIQYVQAWVTGGGGGGEGSINSSGFSGTAGYGGGAGGTALGRSLVIPDAAVTVTVGAAGAAGASNGGDGGDGGDSTFEPASGTLTGSGGEGGITLTGGDGGGASGGDINFKGGDGEGGAFDAGGSYEAPGGRGGASYWGGNGGGKRQAAGRAGQTYGGGGAGGAADAGTNTDYPGGAGFAGLITLEY